jgi:hypothetical protein
MPLTLSMVGRKESEQATAAAAAAVATTIRLSFGVIKPSGCLPLTGRQYSEDADGKAERPKSHKSRGPKPLGRPPARCDGGHEKLADQKLFRV